MQFVKSFYQNNYFTLSTNSLPFKQVVVDKILADSFRNLLIIIILALYSVGIIELSNSFLFSVKKSFLATNSK